MGTDLSLLSSFYAYDARFAGGARVAAHDLNGDGRADIITGNGPGMGPDVEVFDGTLNVHTPFLFVPDPSELGGIFVG